jgi:hypothetical protein
VATKEDKLELEATDWSLNSNTKKKKRALICLSKIKLKVKETSMVSESTKLKILPISGTLIMHSQVKCSLIKIARIILQDKTIMALKDKRKGDLCLIAPIRIKIIWELGSSIHLWPGLITRTINQHSQTILSLNRCLKQILTRNSQLLPQTSTLTDLTTTLVNPTSTCKKQTVPKVHPVPLTTFQVNQTTKINTKSLLKTHKDSKTTTEGQTVLLVRMQTSTKWSSLLRAEKKTLLDKVSGTRMDRTLVDLRRLSHARFAMEQKQTLHSFLVDIISLVFNVHRDVSAAQFVESPSMILLRFISNEHYVKHNTKQIINSKQNYIFQM